MRVATRVFDAGQNRKLYGQLTLLDGSVMVWVGSNASMTRLADAWACAMPSRRVRLLPECPALSLKAKEGDGAASATSLFRSSQSDAAPSLAGRLSRRLKQQVFVSLDLGSLAGHADDVMPFLEQEMLKWLLEEQDLTARPT